MTTGALTVRTLHPPWLRACGLITIGTALVGAACAAVLIAWPEQVPETRWSYPLAAGPYVGSQLVFATHHLGMLVGLWGLTVVGWPRLSAFGRAGLIVTALGTLALTACEAAAIGAVGALAESQQADTINTMYGLATMLTGVGLLLAGTGPARQPVLPGVFGRWTLLAMGIYVFVPLIPAIMGPMVVGRIAIGIWLLMYAGVGITLVRLSRTGRTP